MANETQYCEPCDGTGEVRDAANADADLRGDPPEYVDTTPMRACDTCHGTGVTVTQLMAALGALSVLLRASELAIWFDAWSTWERVYAAFGYGAFDWRGETSAALEPVNVPHVGSVIGAWVRGELGKQPALRMDCERSLRSLRRARAAYVAQLVRCELAEPVNEVISPDRVDELTREATVWSGVSMIVPATRVEIAQMVGYVTALVRG